MVDVVLVQRGRGKGKTFNPLASHFEDHGVQILTVHPRVARSNKAKGRAYRKSIPLPACEIQSHVSMSKLARSDSEAGRLQECVPTLKMNGQLARSQGYVM